MLDINKVYVTLYRDNSTGHVSGANPRMKPFLSTNAMIDYRHGETCLAFWAIGDERGHLLEGTIIRELENGIVFNAQRINETLTLTEFTMQEFEQRCRPDMERFEPGSTRELRTIQDVYAFCRRGAPTIHPEEQEERPMKLTKADIDKVRHIEGFPIARDEDIIALSRPPYYTACPNPFIEDFIREHGTPYDEATDDYHREPFASDTADNKYDKIYHFHPYHTKVPYGSISQHIMHYTKPGDIVFDGFCGSGMTGIAATASANHVLGITNHQNDRHVILNATIEVAHDKTTVVDRLSAAITAVEEETSWMYSTKHELGGTGIINFVAWSDVLICPSCSREYVFWEAAVEKDAGKVAKSYPCPHCNARITKNDSEHCFETYFDTGLGAQAIRPKQVPVLINYSIGKTRYEKKPDELDIHLIEKIESMEIPYWYPVDEMPHGDETERTHNVGITRVHQFYTKRNLWSLASMYDKVNNAYMRFIITKVAFRITKRYGLTYQSGCWGAGGGPTNGTLYIPSLCKELNIVKQLRDAISALPDINVHTLADNYRITTQSSSRLSNIPDDSIDYIYVDPPFGGNIAYSELNYIWESWLKVHTNIVDEAIVNASQHKGLNEYQSLISECFCEFYRILKPNRWITIVFHNSKNSIWNAIQESISRAGFVVADIRVMDKGKMSFVQITSSGAVKNDLVIAAYKPASDFIRVFQNDAGNPDMAWEFVRQHLRHVAIAPDYNNDGKIDVVAERQNYLLYDRMVAWHVMKGIPVPLDAQTFYRGLKERFLERDGMFFLPDQVNEYDEKRAYMDLDVQQLSFIVTDEKNAIQWLHYILGEGPKTYQEIQPLYLQELHQSKQEKMPELLDMLKENFVQDDKGAWYIPDLNNAADLAKVRRKALLKEFYDSCVPGKGKLKVFRMEAIRAGFDECWKQRDFATIVSVGERLPEAALQEDQTLLMYYDNACSRV